ncbi:response regulator transcription factor [Nocardia sp. NPDC050408]|uniref:helix-turn-helix transcriptional regulator n=1 Tax=unclassified Nocardia TaxID=2637762 RepID=UPI003440333A
MRTPVALPPVERVCTLEGLREVVDGPLADIARRLSRFLAEQWPHRALVIFTRECTGRPRKLAGAADIIDRITIAELEELKSAVAPGGSYAGSATLNGEGRWVWAIRDTSNTLLVLVPRTPGELPDQAELAAAFGIVATSIRQQVIHASPEYLAESRAASDARARTTTELTASHEAALAGILVALRSSGLDDHQARTVATGAASDALIALRSRQATDRAFAEEPPVAAFERMQREIGSLVRHRQIQTEFVAPPLDGRPIPGEVAVGARAMTQAAVFALATQPDLDRLRIAWGCESGALVVDIRDRAAGRWNSNTLRRNLEGRVHTLRADLEIESVPDWGSRVLIRLPLDPPPSQPDQPELARLNAREREVLALVAEGKRNKAIAVQLGVAESTVKFHVTALLRKLAVSSRGEAAAIGIRAGLAP